MTRFFLGVDLGGTKTHMLIADENGRCVGFGEGGSGNHQSVGYEGMFHALQTALQGVMRSSGLSVGELHGAGLGIAGYDWPSDRSPMVEVIEQLGLSAPYEIVNDTIPGLVAGSEEGWGVVVVSGTGCNCRGWDREHQREGRMTGYGLLLGEAAGATELMIRAMQMVNYEWTRRGPATFLSQALIDYVGARDLEDLLEGYTKERYLISGAAARLVFQVAQNGDPVARELVHWAGSELGDMANGVIRQLGFETLNFDVVLSGSMFEGGPTLIEPMRASIQELAPGARLIRLRVPPVLGAVLIGMEQGGLKPTPEIRRMLEATLPQHQPLSKSVA